MKWWEKTIEYKFVIDMANKGKFVVAPLDGDEERAGDAIISAEYGWLLIEFKKDKKAIDDEKAKFNCYWAAEEELKGKDQHHLIIYGESNGKLPDSLKLVVKTYFGGVEIDFAQLKEQLKDKGAQLKDFLEYVKKLTEYKKSYRGGSNGGNGLTANDLAVVAGVSADGEIVECLSLQEFQRQFGLEIGWGQEFCLDIDGPSR